MCLVQMYTQIETICGLWIKVSRYRILGLEQLGLFAILRFLCMIVHVKL